MECSERTTIPLEIKNNRTEAAVLSNNKMN